MSIIVNSRASARTCDNVEDTTLSQVLIQDDDISDVFFSINIPMLEVYLRYLF